MNVNMENKFESESGSDRISELPESIRVHILSFLKIEDAVRTSILSTSWRALSTLLPNLDFSSYYYFRMTQLSVFEKDDDASRVKRESIIRIRDGIYAFLDRVSASTLELDKFKLHVPGPGPDLIPRLDRWVESAVRRRVKELELEISARQRLRYHLPKSVLTSNSIMKLKLVKCQLNLSAKLPSLLELCLIKCVMLNEMITGSLLDGCLNLESLTIKDCQGLSQLAIIGHMKLEEVNVEQSRNVVKAIKIVAPNLLKFRYSYDGESSVGKCRIELEGCKKVKILELHGSHLDASDLDAFLEKLPLLQNLVLHNCDRLACVEIYSLHLVNLRFLDCRDLVKVTVDTPNLEFFTYTGKLPICFVSKNSALKLKHTIVSLESEMRDEKWCDGVLWFNGLIRLLAELSHSEYMELEVATEKEVMVPERVKIKFYPPLYAVKHLFVEFRLSRLKSLVEVVESLLWLAPCPESISISDYDFSDHLLIKFLYEKPLKGKNKCGCWDSSINCWRHSLKTVTIINRRRANDNDYGKLLKFFEKERIDGKIECFIKNEEPDWCED